MSKWNVAVYLRLSSDDGDKLESNSITNQKNLITRHLSNLSNTKIYNYYIDDGYTGTDVNRPGYQKMLEDIRDKYVNTIIVKDLSRIGRNYIEVGNFIDEIIPLYSLRFISINDNIDSYLNPDSMNTIEIPFKNLMNENYAKDISNKIRSSHVVRKQQGDYIGVVAPFGYKKDSNDYHKLIIDPEAADIVKRIFDMALKGHTRQEIVKELNELHIITPSLYLRNIIGFKGGKISDEWNVKNIDKILKNEMYIGNMIQGKRKRISHKIHNVVTKAEDEWIKVENTHEPIIDKKIFSIVNDNLYRRNNSINSKGKFHIYSGHIKCADCGATLSRGTRGRDGHVFYNCSLYKRKKQCSSHYISEKELSNLVLNTFNQYIKIVCDIEEQIDNVLNSSKLKYDSEVIKIKRIELQKDINKYQLLVDDLIEDYKNDLITKEELDTYNREYLYKLNTLRISLQDLEKVKNKDINLDWIKKFKTKKELEVIDRNIITEFIDNIFVYEDGNIKIVFKNNNEYLESLKFLKTHNCVI